jgi:hypothetical protein
MDKADIIVAQALDADLCGAIRNGARLVLLADPLQSTRAHSSGRG